MNRGKFSVHLAWTLTARLIVVASNLLGGVIVARWLGAESVGVLASISVMILLAMNIGGFGLSSSVTLLVARDREKLKPVISNAVVFALLSGAATAAVIALTARLKPELFGTELEPLILVAVWTVPFQMLVQFCLAAFLGLRRVAEYNAFDVILQSFVVINPMIAIWALGAGVSTIVWLNLGVAALVGTAVAVYVARLAGHSQPGAVFSPDRRLLGEMLHNSSRFFVAIAASLVMLRADLLIVNYFRGSGEAGVYSVATQASMLLLLVPNVISSMLFPKVTEERDITGVVTCRVTRHAVVIMLTISLIAVPSVFLLPLVYGSAFADVPWQFLIMLPGIFLFGIESVLVQYFSSLGLPRAIPIFWVAVVAVSIALNIMIVPRYGASGAALVSSISYSLIFILVAGYFRIRTGKTLGETFVASGAEIRDMFRPDRFFKAAVSEARV